MTVSFVDYDENKENIPDAVKLEIGTDYEFIDYANRRMGLVVRDFTVFDKIDSERIDTIFSPISLKTGYSTFVSQKLTTYRNCCRSPIITKLIIINKSKSIDCPYRLFYVVTETAIYKDRYGDNEIPLFDNHVSYVATRNIGLEYLYHRVYKNLVKICEKKKADKNQVWKHTYFNINRSIEYDITKVNQSIDIDHVIEQIRTWNKKF